MVGTMGGVGAESGGTDVRGNMAIGNGCQRWWPIYVCVVGPVMMWLMRVIEKYERWTYDVADVCV